jgi:hypothetical protein
MYAVSLALRMTHEREKMGQKGGIVCPNGAVGASNGPNLVKQSHKYAMPKTLP